MYQFGWTFLLVMGALISSLVSMNVVAISENVVAMSKNLAAMSENVFAASENLAALSENVVSMSENLEISSGRAPCPCSSATLCNPITDTTRKEIFAFSVRNDENNWNLFDWSKLTTIVMFNYLNESLMCLAHSHNVRVVILGNVDKPTFLDPAKRKTWIQKQLQLVKDNFLDGLNFDFEGAVAADEKVVRDSYTALVQETNTYFKQQLPYSQISVDVAWKPNVDIRFYDYQALADNSDLLFVMAYDEQSQIFGECLAGPNSAVAAAVEGLTSYFNGSTHISPNKLVLGIPWYGYIYPCLRTNGDKCYIKEVPFRGVNCSDAAGRQYDYSYIYTLIQTMPEKYKWNTSSETPYMTYLNSQTNQTFQVQFDDPTSLQIKYDLAAKLGLRGVGMWNIDSLDYSDSEAGRKIRAAMFGALPSRSNASITSSKFSKPDVRCPCSKPELCNPITDTTRKEVFAFSLVNDENHWKKYDWSKITTICMFKYVNISLMCLAHSYNVRAVVLGEVNETMLITPQLRTEWVHHQLDIVQNYFLDGLNFDVEMAISPEQKDLRDAYTALVNETYQTFKSVLPFSQISIDVITNAFSTYRDYDYPALAAASDFFFIMAYDESGPSRVSFNSALFVANMSIDSYEKRNISASKIVLGLPWYGYIYTCDKLIEDECTLNATKPQSDTYTYDHIFNLLKSRPESYRWNPLSETPYFSFTDSVTGKSYQVQYDDPKSLRLKYDLAVSKGIRGVGMWTIDFLDYSDTPQGETMRESMFAQLPPHS